MRNKQGPAFSRFIGSVLIASAFLFTPGVRAWGQQSLPAADDGVQVPIDTKADNLNYDRKTGWVIATGNVIITKGDTRITANYVRLNIKSEDLHAYGNVVLVDEGSEWKGESLDYNFGKKTGSAVGMTGSTEPFRVIENERVERLG